MIAVSSSLAYCQHSQHSRQHVTYTATLPEKEESTVVVSPLMARVDLAALRPIFNRRPDTCIDSRSGNWTARCHYRSCLEKLAPECVAFCSSLHRLPVEKATDCRFYLYRLAVEKATDCRFYFYRFAVEKATDCLFYLYRLAVEKVTDSILSVPTRFRKGNRLCRFYLYRLAVEKATDSRFYLYRLALEKATDCVDFICTDSL